MEPRPNRPSSITRVSAVAAGGVVGAVARWGQTGLLDDASRFPLGTFTANVLGALVLGALMAALLRASTSHPLWRPALAVGLCGAYTTLGGLADQILGLLQGGDAVLALTYVAASVGAGLVGAHLGRALGARQPSGWVSFSLVLAFASPAIALAATLALRPPPSVVLSGATVAAVAAVAVGGGFGAMARYGVSGWVAGRSSGTFPWGTLVVNVSACLLLGAILGAGTARWPAPSEQLVVTGFVGGCTTFSTLCFETHALLANVERRLATWNLLGNLIGGILAVALGRWIGGLA